MSSLEKRVSALEAAAGINEAGYVLVILQPGETREQALARAIVPGKETARPIYVEFVGTGNSLPPLKDRTPRSADDPLSVMLNGIATKSGNFIRPRQRIDEEGDGA